MGGEVKPAAGKGLKSWVQRHLNVGFAVGFLLVLFTYLVVSQQFAATTPNVVTTKVPRVAEKQAIGASGDAADGEGKRQPERQPEAAAEDTTSGAVPTEESPKTDDRGATPPADKVVCNTEGPVSETCELDGDVRTNGSALSVTLVPSGPSSDRQEWKVRPYSRRTMAGVDRVTVTRLASSPAGGGDASSAPPPCEVTHDAPALLFALGGLTGNYWHDFSDVLVPLFAASRRYGGDVLFLVANAQPWWLAKYEAVLRRLSKYDAVDLGRDTRVRCFRRLAVGLRLHKELSLVPGLASGPDGRPLSMAHFTSFLRDTYALPRAAPVRLSQAPSPDQPRARLLLIHRPHYRRIVNVDEVRRAAEEAGFEVTVASPRSDVAVAETARMVNAHDALVGVHGAGLTNAVFLPAGAVVIQVVPYGKLERMARTDFGIPVADMGLRYLEYSVAAEESTLLEMLGPEHPVIKDPDSVHRAGWDKVAEFYLGKQDVRVDVKRFAPTLAQAIDHLRQQ